MNKDSRVMRASPLLKIAFEYLLKLRWLSILIPL